MEHGSIHEAINAVMQEVGYVKKSKSGGLNYSFAGEAALIAALRPSMVEHGIIMYVDSISDVSRENYTTAKGTQMVNTVIRASVAFRLATSKNPSTDIIKVAAIGEGSDAGDKSANKAMTGLYKYALRQTFCIETGDDPDKYPSEEREVKTESTPKPERPYSPESLKEKFNEVAAGYAAEVAAGGKKGANENTRAILAAGLEQIFPDKTMRYEFSKWATGESSTRKMDTKYVYTLMKWMGVHAFEDTVDPMAKREALSAHPAALVASGQQPLIGD